MKVKMLQDALGSPDGVTVNQYAKGETYDVTTSLGAAFISNGLANEVVPPSTLATKQDVGPEENK